MSSPRISVLMGAYNAEKHIQQAILSVLAQTFEDFELIIVNDGSTDDTLAKINSINDSRIKVITQENLGLTKSLNKALALAKGEFIARQDADDISLFSRFEKQIFKFDADPDLVLLGSSMFISNAKGTFNEIFHYPNTNNQIIRAIFEYNPFVHGAVMVRKKVLEAEGGYNEKFRYVQDYELWSRLALKYNCENLSEPLYARLRESDCSESTIDKTDFVEAIKAKLKIERKTSFTNNEITFITSQNVYPLIGWPFKYCKSLSDTFYKIGTIAKLNAITSKRYTTLSRVYFPWKLLSRSK